MLAVALCIAYISSIGAAFFATGAGFTILPFLNISPEVDGLKELPPVVFELTIPQIDDPADYARHVRAVLLCNGRPCGDLE